MIFLKTPREIEIMRQGGAMLASILKELLVRVQPGISTKELDDIARALIAKNGAKPAFLGYDGYPGAICASINEEVVHAIPSKRILKEGDLCTIDIGLLYKGLNLDMARTVGVGALSSEAQQLLAVTQEAMKLGVAKALPGNRVGDIGHAISQYSEKHGYGVVRDLCGHGIGKQLHEDPMIPNFGKEHTGALLKEGMVICIEPMIVEGNWKVKESKDGYGFLTKDGSLACHVEDTIAITSSGPDILTK